MTTKERMQKAISRQSIDRLPVQTNYTEPMGKKLAAHFKVSPADLPARLGNHLTRVDLTFPPKFSADGAIRFDWWGAGWDTRTEGYWLAHSPLPENTSLDAFNWPDPESKSLLSQAGEILVANHQTQFIVPNFGMCLFERAWSLRGFDALLMNLATDPQWVDGLLEKITEIQIVLARRFLALGVDGGYFGDDYGAQRGLLFSPELWRRLFKPRLKRMFAVFRDAGLPVILHSDGDIRAILPDLVDIGVNCLNPVQPEVLDHQKLHQEFGKDLSFYGGISTQTVLPRGTPSEVRSATRACAKDLASDGTGLILGPSHRMQMDIPVENVEAMLEAFPRNET